MIKIMIVCVVALLALGCASTQAGATNTAADSGSMTTDAPDLGGNHTDPGNTTAMDATSGAGAGATGAPSGVGSPVPGPDGDPVGPAEPIPPQPQPY